MPNHKKVLKKIKNPKDQKLIFFKLAFKKLIIKSKILNLYFSFLKIKNSLTKSGNLM